MDLTTAAHKGRRMPTAQLRRLDGEVECRLEGEFDVGCTDVMRIALERAVAEGEPRVVVDLSQVTFMDSSGLQVLLQARERLAGEGRFLRTRRPQPQVARLLELGRAQYGVLI